MAARWCANRRGIVATVLAFWLRFLTARRIRTYPGIALGAIIAAAVIHAVVSPDAPWTISGGDFRAFYTAGALVGSHRSGLLYRLDAQTSFQAQTFPGEAGEHVSMWLNPPFLAWPFVPLSRLPFAAALAIHTAVGLALALAALTCLERELGTPKRRAMIWAAATFYPTLQWLMDGQLTSVALLLFAGMFVFLRRGMDSWAGVLVGCLAYKPQLALGLLAALVGARRFRALLTACAAGLGWAALSYATLPGATLDYLEHAPGFDALLRQESYPRAGLHGLFQFATLLLDGFSPRAATAVGSALTLLALLALVLLWAREPWRPGTVDWDRRMAATLALSVIASPHLFGYDLMLLLVPFAIVWHLYPGGTAGRPFDGGPLLAATALVWALALVGPALTVAEQTLTRWAFGRAFALQIGVVAIGAWSWLVARAPAGKAAGGALSRTNATAR